MIRRNEEESDKTKTFHHRLSRKPIWSHSFNNWCKLQYGCSNPGVWTILEHSYNSLVYWSFVWPSKSLGIKLTIPPHNIHMQHKPSDFLPLHKMISYFQKSIPIQQTSRLSTLRSQANMVHGFLTLSVVLFTSNVAHLPLKSSSHNLVYSLPRTISSKFSRQWWRGCGTRVSSRWNASSHWKVTSVTTPNIPTLTCIDGKEATN